MLVPPWQIAGEQSGPGWRREMTTTTTRDLIRTVVIFGCLVAGSAQAGIQDAPSPPAIPSGELGPGVPVEPPASASPSHPAQGYVARAQFTRGVVGREPIDELHDLPPDLDKLYFFTELRDMTGQTVIHRWEHEGEVVAEVKMKVGGPRWRTYSSKQLPARREGRWSVVVLDEQGWPIKASHIDFRSSAVGPTSARE